MSTTTTSKKSKQPKQQQSNNNNVQVVSQKETVNQSLTQLDLKQIDVETLVQEEQRLLKALEAQQQQQQPKGREFVENLSTVLLQALHTKDEELLYFSLEKEDAQLIDNTIKNLLSSKVPTLIKFLAEAILKRPYKSHYYIRWVKGLLRHHTTILLNNACLPIIQSLRTTLQQRTSNFEDLLKLKGKLSAVNPDQNQAHKKKEPRNVYVDEQVEKQANNNEGAAMDEEQNWDDQDIEGEDVQQ